MMLRNLSKAKRGKREQRVRGLEGWKKRRVQGFGKERVQGVKDSRGQVEKGRRQNTEVRSQEAGEGWRVGYISTLPNI